MKSREQIAIEALTEARVAIVERRPALTLSRTSTVNTYLSLLGSIDGAIAALSAPPAQGSIDAGGLPPLPESKYCADDLADIFTADQMRAYALADRAARQSAAPDEVVGLRDALISIDSQLVAILNGADGSVYSRLKAVRNDLVRIWLPLGKPAAPTAAERECGNCHGSGRMVREPDIGTDQECFSCDGKGKVEDDAPTAPTATSGGEAVADWERKRNENGRANSSVIGAGPHTNSSEGK